MNTAHWETGANEVRMKGMDKLKLMMAVLGRVGNNRREKYGQSVIEDCTVDGLQVMEGIRGWMSSV